MESFYGKFSQCFLNVCVYHSLIIIQESLQTIWAFFLPIAHLFHIFQVCVCFMWNNVEHANYSTLWKNFPKRSQKDGFALTLCEPSENLLQMLCVSWGCFTELSHKATKYLENHFQPIGVLKECITTQADVFNGLLIKIRSWFQNKLWLCAWIIHLMAKLWQTCLWKGTILDLKMMNL